MSNCQLLRRRRRQALFLLFDHLASSGEVQSDSVSGIQPSNDQAASTMQLHQFYPFGQFVNRENVFLICLWAVEVTVYFRDDCSAASAPLASKHIIKHKSKPETWHLKFGPSSQIWCHCFYHKTVSEDLLEQILTLAAILATKSTSSLPKSLQIKMTSQTEPTKSRRTRFFAGQRSMHRAETSTRKP